MTDVTLTVFVFYPTLLGTGKHPFYLPVYVHLFKGTSFQEQVLDIAVAHRTSVADDSCWPGTAARISDLRCGGMAPGEIRRST